MKARVHLRVAYNKRRRAHAVNATITPINAPLTNARGEPLPTVAFGLVLDIPDAMFAQAEQIIAELTIPESAARIAVEVKQ